MHTQGKHNLDNLRVGDKFKYKETLLEVIEAPNPEGFTGHVGNVVFKPNNGEDNWVVFQVDAVLKGMLDNKTEEL